MATVITAAVANAALDAALTGATKLSLHTGAPGAAGTANELDTGAAPGYARATISFDAAASSSKGLHAAVDFTASGGNWPQVTYIGVWASTTFLCSCALTTARQINDGQKLHFAIGGVAMAAAGA